MYNVVVTDKETAVNRHIGFFFGLGHGHYTQFLNFQECVPPEARDHTHWFAVRGDQSADPIARLPFLPAARRWARNEMWHVRRGLATRDQWDAVFCSLSSIDLLTIARRERCYLYTDLTDSLKRELAPWYDHQLRHSGPAAQLKANLRRRLHHACRGIFTMSEWAARGVCRDYDLPASQVHVVHPGANLKRWSFVDRVQRSAESPVRILMVGGQFRLKGGQRLLDWAAHTPLTGWELDIVTWPGELPEWVKARLDHPDAHARISRSLAPHLPNVRIHCGLQANSQPLLDLYAAADIFCLPTQADGSSIASLEAMATGLPVIVGAVGGIPELVRHGTTGFLIAPGADRELAETLERLIGDPALRLRIGRAARQACEQQFNVTRQLRDILTIIDRDVAADRQRAGVVALGEPA